MADGIDPAEKREQPAAAYSNCHGVLAQTRASQLLHRHHTVLASGYLRHRTICLVESVAHTATKSPSAEVLPSGSCER
jgi:hypothetical protein